MDFVARMARKKERIERLEDAFMVGFGIIVGSFVVMCLMAVIM